MRDFRGGGRDGGRQELHDAVCNECGKDCRVPFRPSGDKPIYCSECFEQKGGGGRSNRRDSFRSSRPRFNDRGSGYSDFLQLNKNIEVLNSRLEKVIFLLESKGEKVKTKKKKTEMAELVESLKSKKVDKKTK